MVKASFDEMLASTSPAIQLEVSLEFAISNRIYELMTERGISKLQLAQALGKRQSEVTKWLSGQHNFTIKTLSMLSFFFGESLVSVERAGDLVEGE